MLKNQGYSETFKTSSNISSYTKKFKNLKNYHENCEIIFEVLLQKSKFFRFYRPNNYALQAK